MIVERGVRTNDISQTIVNAPTVSVSASSDNSGKRRGESILDNEMCSDKDDEDNIPRRQ